ncbi:MAG: FAD-dependent oxidoreductase [Oscillospiraceae bacterium]|jgi:hypothetical protein|nr:FAD-dependent oxidoreductase [Oscillospiraceae bacterium]
MVYDVVVIGAGMGGCGAAAWFAKKSGLKVALIEKYDEIGGTAVVGGVNCFEPGVAQGDLHAILAGKLLGSGEGQVQKSTPGFPNEKICCRISADSGDPYAKTLRRAGFADASEKYARRFMFDDKAMAHALREQIERGNVDIKTGWRLAEARAENRRIKSVVIENAKYGRETVEGSLYIDCSGDIVLARRAGCSVAFGGDSKDEFNEISAPPEKRFELNGVSYIFRISKSGAEHKIDATENVEEWFEKTVAANKLGVCLNYYPNGDINVNMLPTMGGGEYFSLPQKKAEAVCLSRVSRFWDWLKHNPHIDLAGYGLASVFPLPGIRETYRLRGAYVLTQNDILASLPSKKFKNRIIAYADHALDSHGSGPACAEVDKPYGIPYECMIPNEIDNLAVACRGASFSQIAASSCRLSRTMMRLGEVAAMACGQALKTGRLLRDIELTDEMRP